MPILMKLLLYLNKNGTKVIGRLLPISPFEALKSENNRVLLKLMVV